MLNKFTAHKNLVAISLVLSAFLVYPNINSLLWAYTHSPEKVSSASVFLFFFRYMVFVAMLWGLLALNMRRFCTHAVAARFAQTFALTLCIYGFYVAVSLLSGMHNDCFSGLLLFQFLVACLICVMVGHIYLLYSEQHAKELEIERLQRENLQSRCDALANQINPHFFFNSLNGLTALVRSDKKAQTLEYINKLSGVFRYILQSDKKGLVPLREELAFSNSFRYLLEVRYADKLRFCISVAQEKNDLQLPVLSLLPLIENVVEHNMIDSENQMCISVYVSEQNELVVSNPICQKLDRPDKTGIGLANLSDRFRLLLNKAIRIESKDDVFSVYLPLVEGFSKPDSC